MSVADIAWHRGALMVCGTTSNAGKTTIVAGLCRLLARQGIRVAPFKAQNMALNSAVTVTGHEIGRAQYLQAQAAGVTPEVAMNPILLKPTGERSSQVVVNGRPIGVMSAVEYHEAKPELFSLVLDALSDLRSRFDVVLLEGAGSPAEINLLPHDIVNLRLAERAGIRAIVVGDIDPGGVFASLYGTVAVLPSELRDLIGGFVINKLRGDPALLLDGIDQLKALSGVPTLGVVPMLNDLRLDAEDSLALDHPPEVSASASLDVAVIRFPRISNFTDLDPLVLEPDVAVRYVRSGRELGRPDLVVLPGSKATVDDLRWLRNRGLDQAIIDLVTPPARRGRASNHTTIIGICGGYQMLGQTIRDEFESGDGTDVSGLGLLPVETTFAADKVLAAVWGEALGYPIEGYQIHHGRVLPQRDGAAVPGDERQAPEGGRVLFQRDGAAVPGDERQAPEGESLDVGEAPGDERQAPEGEVWLYLQRAGEAVPGDKRQAPDGVAEGTACGSVFGTTVHGLFDNDDFRREFLRRVAVRAGASFAPGSNSFADDRQRELDRLADHLADSLDVEGILRLLTPVTSERPLRTA